MSVGLFFQNENLVGNLSREDVFRLTGRDPGEGPEQTFRRIQGFEEGVQDQLSRLASQDLRPITDTQGRLTFNRQTGQLLSERIKRDRSFGPAITGRSRLFGV